MAACLPLLESLFLPSPAATPVIHPDFKELGRLWIPASFVLPTTGLQRFQAQHPHAPSLCTLFQRGKCKSNGRCNQVHIDPDFARVLAGALAACGVSNCCRRHGDPPSLASSPFAALVSNNIEMKLSGQPSIQVPTELIATTFFWNRLSQERRPSLFFPVERLCLLHQRGQCTFGVECRNVHVCRQWWAQISGHIPVPTPLPSPLRALDRNISANSLGTSASSDSSFALSEEINSPRELGGALYLPDTSAIYIQRPKHQSPPVVRVGSPEVPRLRSAPASPAASKAGPSHKPPSSMSRPVPPPAAPAGRGSAPIITTLANLSSVADLSFDDSFGSEMFHFEAVHELQESLAGLSLSLSL